MCDGNRGEVGVVELNRLFATRGSAGMKRKEYFFPNSLTGKPTIASNGDRWN
jgi:hypothetical protein